MSRYSDLVQAKAVAYWKLVEHPAFDLEPDSITLGPGMPPGFTDLAGTWARGTIPGTAFDGAVTTGSSPDDVLTVIDAGHPDVLIRVRPYGTTGVGAAFRVVNINNYLAAVRTATGVQLVKVQAGVETVLVPPVAVTDGQVVHIAAVGDDITVALAGVEIAAYTLTSAEVVTFGAATQVGLRMVGEGTGGINYFSAQAPATLVADDAIGSRNGLFAYVYNNRTSLGDFGAWDGRSPILDEPGKAGESTRIELPADPAFETQSFSVELWAFATNGAGRRQLWAYTDRAIGSGSLPTRGISVYVDETANNNTPIRGAIYDATGASKIASGPAGHAGMLGAEGTPSEQKMKHVVLVHDAAAAQLTLYVDGVPGTVVSTTGFTIGHHVTPVHRTAPAYELGGFDPQVTHLAFYDSALSAAEVAEHYTAATTEAPLASPVARTWVDQEDGGTLHLSATNLNQVEGELRAARSRVPHTYLVAPSDAPDRLKRMADFVCDGVNDEAEINMAIRNLDTVGGGGSVRLLPGTFFVGVAATHGSYGRYCILIHPALGGPVSLRGEGRSTTIRPMPGVDTCTLLIAESTQLCDIGDLRLYGAGEADVDGAVVNVSYSDVQSLMLEELSVGVQIPGYSNNVREVTFRGVVVPIWLADSTENHIADLVGEGYVTDGVGVRVSGGASLNSIVGGNLEGCERAGVLLDSGAYANTVSGVEAYWGGPAVVLDDAHGNAISGVGAHDINGDGIVIENGSSRNVIGTSSVIGVDSHGIRLSGAVRNTVQGTLVAAYSRATDETFDGIHLTGGSDRNLIQGNNVSAAGLPELAAGAGKGRNGVRINTADCDGNWVVLNDLRDSSTLAVPESFHDSGTGTVTATANQV